MSNRAPNLLSRKLTFAAALVMISAIATLAAFGPQAISLQRFLTPFVGASVAPQQSFKEVESQLHAEPPAPMSMLGGTLAAARSGHTATLLADGKVLILGGSGDTSAEVFDPASGMSVATGNTNYARTGHTATTLSDGRVLIAGGGSASTEIYDSAAGTFANGPDMTTARSGHTATAVGTSVVISGGGSASVEVFDGTAFTAAGTLTESRTDHSAALMNDGRIFIAGGTGSDTAEIYNPADGTSVATGNPLAHQRAKAHLRVLPDGKVQIIGGNDDASMEVYDPAIDTIGAHVHLLPDTDTCTGLRTGVRDSQTRAALFYAGNADGAYDRTGHTITEVAGNRALVIGGTSGGNATNTVTDFASAPATITTDKLDYAPGETVTFNGTNFAAGETVRVVIHEDPHTHLERNFEAVADSFGNISGSYLVEEHDLNVKFIVNARGSSSNLTAQTAFTDARLINSVTLNGSSSVTVAPGATITAVVNVTTDGSGANARWQSTGWRIDSVPGSFTCVNHADHNSAGTYSETFSMTAPATGGVYNAYFMASVDDGCSDGGQPAGNLTLASGVTVDNTSPTVTINQVVGQNDPTNTSPINFTAVFSESVNNFAGVDIDLGGTAGATTAVVTGGPTTFNVAVSGMTSDGTVSASIAANRATDAAGNQNTASTSTDHIVTYDATVPTVLSITRNSSSPTNAGQVTWTITFSESVTGVDPTDFNFPMTGLTGTATLSLFGGSGTTYTFTTGTRNGSGTIGLNLNDNDTIADAAGNKLGGTGTGTAGSGGPGNGSLVGEVYTIDRTITTVIAANDKPYDGGVTATLASCTRTSALAITDDVQVVCSSPTFDDPNAGSRTVTANITLTGADASGYVLSSTTATDMAEITAVQADCASVAGQTVPYDGNAHVGVGVCKDLGGNALAGLNWGPGQTNVPGGSVGWSFTSGDPNYANNPGGNVTVNITPASTTTVINCSPGSFVYTGAPLTPCTANVTGANLATTTAVTYGNNTNVGTATAGASYAGDANHTGSTATQVTFAITPASTATTVTCPASEVYTGTAIEPCTFTVSGANLTIGPSPLTSGDYSNNVIVGIASASYTYVPDANHTGSSDSETFNIIPASTTTVVTCPASVVYTGSPIEPCTFTVSGANLNLGPTSLASSDYSNNVNVGTATASYTYLPDANHTGSDDSTTFEILQAATALTVLPATGVYGGTVDLYATLTRTDAPAGPLDGKTISFKLNGNSVGAAVTDINGQASLLGVHLTTNGMLSGTRIDADVYTNGVDASFAAETNFTGSDDADDLQVNQKPVTASVTAQNKTYDGGNAATIDSCTVAVLETDDVVTCSAAGPNTFASVNAANGITVTATNITLAGDDAANYVLSSSSATTTANILTKGLGAHLLAANKVYDGNTDEPDANMSCSFSGIIAGEELNVTCTPSAGSFDSKDVVTASQVTATVMLGGTAAGNYTLGADGTDIDSTGASAAANITPRTLTASIVNNPTKPYDGNTNATLLTSNFDLSNLVGTEDFDVTQTSGTYSPDANAGAKTVSASLAPGNFTPLGATLGSNYTLPTSASGAGTITTIDPTCSITGGTFPYDGSPHGAVGTCKDINGIDLATLNLGASFTDVPGGTANWTFTSANANYNDKSGSVMITITAIDADCSSIAGGSHPYDGNPHTLTGSCKDINGNDLTGLVFGTGQTDVPGGSVTWTFTSPSVNYNSDSGSEIVTITAIDPNCSSITGGTFPYDGNAHGATGSCKDINGVNLTTLNLGSSFTNVPGGTANWTFTSTNANYNNKSGSVSIAITKVDPTCSISGYTGVYDGNPHGASGTCTGVVGQTIPTIGSLNLGASFTNVPGGTSNWTFTGGTNYNDKSGSVAIVLTQATPTVSVTGGTFLFNGAPHPATGFAYGVGGIGDVLTPAVTFQYVGTGSTAYPATTTPPTFVGTYQVTATFAGNVNYTGTTGTASITITTIFCFNGFQSPVGGSVESGNGGSYADPVKSFKLNSTIPFKFTLYNVGCSGSPIITGVHTIQLQKYSSQTDPQDTAIDATPTDAATTGNQFRLTGTDWHFNLDTKKTPGLSAGTWLVTATLFDGSKKTVWISIKK